MPTVLNIPDEILRAIFVFLAPSLPAARWTLMPAQRGSGDASQLRTRMAWLARWRPASEALRAACLTCSRFRSAAQPVLFRTISLSPFQEVALLETLLRRPDLGRHVRVIRTQDIWWQGPDELESLVGFLEEERPSLPASLEQHLTREHLLGGELTAEEDDAAHVGPATALLSLAPNVQHVEVVYGGFSRQPFISNVLGRDDDKLRLRRLCLRSVPSQSLKASDLELLLARPGLEALCLSGMGISASSWAPLPAPTMSPPTSSITALRLFFPGYNEPTFDVEALEHLLVRVPGLQELAISCPFRTLEVGEGDDAVIPLDKYAAVLRAHGTRLRVLDLCFSAFGGYSGKRKGLGSLRELTSLSHLSICRHDFLDGIATDGFPWQSSKGEAPKIKHLLPQGLQTLFCYDVEKKETPSSPSSEPLPPPTSTPAAASDSPESSRRLPTIRTGVARFVAEYDYDFWPVLNGHDWPGAYEYDSPAPSPPFPTSPRYTGHSPVMDSPLSPRYSPRSPNFMPTSPSYSPVSPTGDAPESPAQNLS